MNAYMKEKPTTETIPNLEQQTRQRVLPHSYETRDKQKLRQSPDDLKRKAGGVAVRTILNSTEVHSKRSEENFVKRLL